MSLSDSLKSLRKAKGWSASHVARTLGLADSTYRNYELGQNEPKNEILISLAKLYNCSVDYLLGVDKVIHTPQVQKVIENMDKLSDEGKATVSTMSDAMVALEENKIKSTPKVTPLFKEQEFEYVTEDDYDNEDIYTKIEVATSAAAGSGGWVLTELQLDPSIAVVKDADVPNHDFAFRVSGYSMEPTIHQGSVAIFRDCNNLAPKDGEIYAVWSDGGLAIKRVYVERNKVTLESDNEDFDDIILKDGALEDFKIIGKFIGSYDVAKWLNTWAD